MDQLKTSLLVLAVVLVLSLPSLIQAGSKCRPSDYIVPVGVGLEGCTPAYIPTKTCSGLCSSHSQPRTDGTGGMENHCKCCHPNPRNATSFRVNITCTGPNEGVKYFYVPRVTKCDCRVCSDSRGLWFCGQRRAAFWGCRSPWKASVHCQREQLLHLVCVSAARYSVQDNALTLAWNWKRAIVCAIVISCSAAYKRKCAITYVVNPPLPKPFQHFLNAWVPYAISLLSSPLLRRPSCNTPMSWNDKFFSCWSLFSNNLIAGLWLEGRTTLIILTHDSFPLTVEIDSMLQHMSNFRQSLLSSFTRRPSQQHCLVTRVCVLYHWLRLLQPIPYSVYVQ